MPFCKFHGTVRVKHQFLEINILRAISGDLFVTVMAENDISRFPEKDLSGVRIGALSPYATDPNIQ